MRNILLTTLAVVTLSVPATGAERVATPAFRSIQLMGGGRVTVRPGPVQRVTILTGSSAFTQMRVDRSGQLRIAACNNRCPRNYDLQILIEAPRLPDMAISGGGEIAVARGFAPESDVAAAIRGGGVIDALQVQTRTASAAISGGGVIKVRASSSLNAAIRGGGEVGYVGNPQVSSAISGGGGLRRLR
ncbi:hypothetical protein G7077_02585 [Sphingomonas piscis]|uniref:Putative auto-transporter adhesin head GIN domain-containing protein n=1 Tax=Sphingomonas piscis TaxID=2714943 RepID=A0A6G7YMJ1_9SPHN|nr:DUF2807 domain-containing protein [Sphingomonas piscis]QIK77965.1 hypothetical protein G7077_02585 [Sphingomonas piscis]